MKGSVPQVACIQVAHVDISLGDVESYRAGKRIVVWEKNQSVSSAFWKLEALEAEPPPCRRMFRVLSKTVARCFHAPDFLTYPRRGRVCFGDSGTGGEGVAGSHAYVAIRVDRLRDASTILYGPVVDRLVIF